ncbi:MAG: toprim domain-containing protein [Ignavibacteriae bacterium]|nr:toprim domain-containing protein [Ignavibacteriota bacterium]
MEFINWEILEFKKQSGKEKLRCPNCDARRSDKKDKSLLINHNDGYGKCFYCEALTFRDKNEVEKEYILPKQDWRNFTKLSDKLVKWFEGRKIHQNTLNNFNITEEKHYQPQLKKEVNNVVFNYFEGETLINKKYRSAHKKFTQSAGTKNIFYNINSIINEKECYIVEGEIDVLSLYEVGIKNAISVPNGANDTDDVWKNCEKYLKDIELFYIATDNDAKGNEVSEKIAQRLGRWRCKRIIFNGKDANDDLINGNLKESIKNIKKYPVNGTYTMNDMYDDVLELYDSGIPKTIYPKHHCFGNLKNIFSVMIGHLVTVTGIPSHGKSAFTEWYVMNLVKDYDFKASFFSPEHLPLKMHQTTFIEKAFGKNFWREVDNTPRISKDEIKRWDEWSSEKIYLTTPEKGDFPTWDWLFDKFKEQMFNFGINIFIIDAFNKVQLQGNGSHKEKIDNILSKLTMFAQMNNVIIFLVAHPTKMSKNEHGIYSAPSLYDVSGSADFRNQTHDGFCIYRTFSNPETGQDDYNTFINLKTKLSFQGKIGDKVDLKYHLPSGRMYDINQYAPTFDITKNYEEQRDIKPVEPTEVFDELAF